MDLPGKGTDPKYTGVVMRGDLRHVRSQMCASIGVHRDKKKYEALRLRRFTLNHSNDFKCYKVYLVVITTITLVFMIIVLGRFSMLSIVSMVGAICITTIIRVLIVIC